MKKLFIISGLLLLFATLQSCNKERTPYLVEYRIDNTDIHSEYFKVFEQESDSMLNGKWRGDFHHYDTIIENGKQHIYAYGSIKDVARQGCTSLVVMLDGMVENLHGWKLDTVFQLRLGEDNHFVITPDMKWIDTWEDYTDSIQR